jgi:hypothetical protein
VILMLACAVPAMAQTVSQRGFVDGVGILFPQEAPNDATQLVGDLLAREEVFVKPAPWLQVAGGLEFRANSHDQVDGWQLDFLNRGILRPRLTISRLSATLTRGRLRVDLGKQFIRWGKTDILTPTDRFAPRDFLNVVDNYFLAVTGVRASVEAGRETFDVAWVPWFTPSRVPLLDQRWTAVPPQAASVPLVDAGHTIPGGSQVGARWSHAGEGFEFSVSFFDGFNHLPNTATLGEAGRTFQVRRIAGLKGPRYIPGEYSVSSPEPPQILVSFSYPAIKTYGADAAVPTRWFTIKGEAEYFTSSSPDTNEYALYVLQLERQTGEWQLVVGYTGEVVTARRALVVTGFAPDQGLAQSFVGRASYTIDSNRSVSFESAVHQNGRGVYAKAEYSQARGQHWRATATGVFLGGDQNDFLGQYHLNSYLALALRYSF